jgi:protocatechuate 3,4-dioxygenase beta subunit
MADPLPERGSSAAASTPHGELLLDQGGSVFSGDVRDVDGGPVIEAILTVDSSRFGQGVPASGETARFESGTEGRFAARLRPGHYRLVVSADGYAAAEHWLDLTAKLQRSFELERAGSIAGRVVARAEGEPVANALVELMITGAYRLRPDAGDPRAPAKVSEVLANAQGAFRLTGVAAGNYLLVARRGNLVGQRTTVVTLQPGDDVQNADVTIEDGLFVKGRVTSGTSVPIAQARVSLTAVGFNPRVLQATDTDAKGVFSLQGLLPGAYRLDVRAGGFGSFMKEIGLQQSSLGHEIVLPAETRVQGRLLAADERAVTNAAVTLWNSALPNPRSDERITRTLRTDAEGRFVFDSVTPGSFWLEAADGAGAAALGPESIVAGETKRVELRFGAGIGISGQVKWKGGGPASDVLVRCKGSLSDRSVRSDAAGNYRCHDLTPDMYVVAAVRDLADEPWYIAANSADSYGGQRVWLVAGQSERGVDIELGRDANSVSGVVLDADGTPAANVVVSASREVFGASLHATNPRAIDGTARTSDDGTFRIEGLPEGPYQLRAQSIDGEGRLDEVAAGSRVRIELARTSALRGIVLDDEGRPATSFTVFVYLGGTSKQVSYSDAVARAEGAAIAVLPVFDRAGRFEVAGLRSGAYEVVASTADQRSGRATAMLAGDGRQPDLKIHLERAATLSGRVVDHETGAPVEACEVEAAFDGRQVTAVTDRDGTFRLTGPVTGQTVRLRFGAAGFIGDMHTAAVVSSRGADIGTIRIIRGSWVGTQRRQLDWVLEGNVVNTEVAAVRPGSPLQRAGVVPGAVVLQVGDENTRQLGPLSVTYLSCRVATALRLVLLLPDGSRRTVQL